jgi:fumarate hydratase subunit beta
MKPHSFICLENRNTGIPKINAPTTSQNGAVGARSKYILRGGRYMSKRVYLHTPLSEEDIRELQLDDVVYVTGEAYTMLFPDHYTRVIDSIKAGKPLPVDFKDGMIYNTGTIYQKGNDGNYKLYALGATTSSKFNAYTPEFIELTGIRAIIGKGGMDNVTLATMQKNGCVYLAIVGGCSAVYTPTAELETDYWPELTLVDNQRLKLRMNQFGPLFVAMDAHGNSIYEQCANSLNENLPAIYRKLGVKEK